MSDSRFASLKTDPRFRRPKKHQSKVVLDDRFRHLLQDDDNDDKHKKQRVKRTSARVDKYGRAVPETQEKDDLRRFYRLEAKDGEDSLAAAPTIVDYARGAVLMESSDEEDQEDQEEHEAKGDAASPAPSEDESESDHVGFVSLGPEPDAHKDDSDLEVDLDENMVAVLDAQVAAYARAVPERETAVVLPADVKHTRRLAVVNLDWDYVRAAHLFKIFSSLVSPTASLALTSTPRTEDSMRKGRVNMARGRIISVRVYPSEFGKKRMAREEKEGPPVELFGKNKKIRGEEINEQTIIETGTEADYDEDALRKYQLERLRYYYAIVECDTVEAAAHVYNELEGTELERSANVFDLSFVPDDMTFDDEPRDEATGLSDAPYRAVEFVTDALRHSKVKLTWDEDDPERHHVLRRPLTKEEIDEADFRAYIASSSSSEDEGAHEVESENTTGGRGTKNVEMASKKAERKKLRKLLLGGNDDLLEGQGNAFDNKESRRGKGQTGRGSDVDMEVTFMPGLSETKNPGDENTLERYQRKMKEKRKKKKEGRKKGDDDVDGGGDRDGMSNKTIKSNLKDEFFGVESDSPHEEAEASPNKSEKKSIEDKKPTETSKAELALLAVSDSSHGEPTHFDMKAILKAEKNKNKKSKHKSKKRNQDEEEDEPRETQDDFMIDVKDERFAAIHEDHHFAIDPTNPQFKKTKSMAALLDERAKRQKSHSRFDHPTPSQSFSQQSGRSLQNLVESVKRKSSGHGGLGKRRKLVKS